MVEKELGLRLLENEVANALELIGGKSIKQVRVPGVGERATVWLSVIMKNMLILEHQKYLRSMLHSIQIREVIIMDKKNYPHGKL